MQCTIAGMTHNWFNICSFWLLLATFCCTTSGGEENPDCCTNKADCNQGQEEGKVNLLHRHILSGHRKSWKRRTDAPYTGVYLRFKFLQLLLNTCIRQSSRPDTFTAIEDNTSRLMSFNYLPEMMDDAIRMSRVSGQPLGSIYLVHNNMFNTLIPVEPYKAFVTSSGCVWD